MSTELAPTGETTVALVPLCGHPAESMLRALDPLLAACSGDANVALVIARLEAGEVIVATSAVIGSTAPARVLITLDGRPVASLPESPPLTPADRDALAIAATVVSHGGPVFADTVSARRLAPWETRFYVDDVALGPRHDARGERYVSVANEVVDGTRTTMSFEASVDARGHVEIVRVPLARFLGDGPERGVIVALESAPPVARTSGAAAVCGSADEAAIRLRVPELPPCAEDRHAIYVAASTTEGILVTVGWRGIHGGAITTIGARRRGIPSPMAPSTPDDLASIAAAIVLAMDGRAEIAIDDAAARALVSPGESSILSRLGGDHVGVRREGDDTHLTAVSLQRQDRDDGLSRWIVRCDVTIDPAGSWRAERRTLSRLLGDHEEEGLQARPQPYPEPITGGLEF